MFQEIPGVPDAPRNDPGVGVSDAVNGQSISMENWRKREAEVLAATALVAPAAVVAPAVNQPEVSAAPAAVKDQTARDLEALRGSIGGLEQFKKFVEMVNMKDESFTGKIPVDIAKHQVDLAAEVLKVLQPKSEGLKEFATLLNQEPEKVAGFVASLSAVSILQKVKSHFEEKHPRFAEFKTDPPYAVSYKAVVNGFNDFAISYTSDPEGFEAAYNAKFPAPQVPEAAASDAKAAPTAEEAQIKDNAEAIEKTFLGKMLLSLGLVKVEEGGFGAVVTGKNGIAAFIIGLFGGGALLKGSVYEDMVKDIPGKYQPMLTAIKEKASTSPLSLKRTAENRTAEVASGELKPMDASEFGKLVAAKGPIDEKGIKLTEEYPIPDGKKLKVDLSAGEIVLAKGLELTVDGKPVTAVDSDKVIKRNPGDIPVVLSGKLPKDLVIKGKPIFELVTV